MYVLSHVLLDTNLKVHMRYSTALFYVQDYFLAHLFDTCVQDTQNDGSTLYKSD